MNKVIKNYFLQPFVILLLAILFIEIGSCYASARSLTIHFLNVGAADSIFIKTPNGKTILFDSGRPPNLNQLNHYLPIRSIREIDVLLFTHLDEGNLKYLSGLIRRFKIRQLYMPQVKTPDKIMKQFLTTIEDKGTDINMINEEAFINIDPAITIETLVPIGKIDKNIENSCMMVKMIYNRTTFLLIGNMTIASRIEMLTKKYNLKANLLEMGCQGLNHPTTFRFLNAVSPLYAIIPLGVKNHYYDPTQYILRGLKSNHLKIYRNYQNKAIVAISDGQKIVLTQK